MASPRTELEKPVELVVSPSDSYDESVYNKGSKDQARSKIKPIGA